MGNMQRASADSTSGPLFGDVLRRLRRAAGLTQEELAERAHLSPRGLSDLERGVNRFPRRGTVLALSDALTLSAEEHAYLMEVSRRRSLGGRMDELHAADITVAPEALPMDVVSPSGLPGPASAEGGAARGVPPLQVFLIADIRDSTRYTVAHGDRAWAELAMRFAAIAREAAEAHGGYVLELRGDEALCVFASARAALQAAVDLQNRLASAAQQDAMLRLASGIGLDAGEAIPVPGGFRGLALNIAARLCSRAGPGEVLTSETVVNLARKVEGIHYSDRGPVLLKGIAEPVRVFQIRPAEIAEVPEEKAPQPATPRAHAEPSELALPIGGFLGALPEKDLVARDREMEKLQAVLAAVHGGAGRLVVLAGEAGIGKTRLAQEVTLAARDRGFLIATGRCYAPQETVPYYPFLEALSRAHAIAPAAIRAQLPQRWPEVAHLLPDLDAGMRPPGTGLAGSGGHEDQQRLFYQVTGFLVAVTETQPLALLFDDLHWADGTSLALLQHLARHTRTAPILLLGTYRDVEVQPANPLVSALGDLGREHLIERIAVGRLPQEGTAALLGVTLGEGEVSEAVARLVHAPTAGNAFFAQEVVRTLVERGDVTRVGGRWVLREGAELAVPENVRATILERASRLSPLAHEMLSVASVLGQTIAFDDLLVTKTLAKQAGRSQDSEQAVDESGLEAAVEAALEETVGAGLLRGADGESYVFSHALAQRAIYEQLPSRRRRRLHKAAAEAIERLPEGVRTRRVGEIAYHFLEANETARAFPYALQAGDQAQAVYASTAAVRHYRTAHGLAQALEDPAREAEALERLGQLFWGLTDYDRALEALRQAIEAYRLAGDREGMSRTNALIGRSYARLCRVEEGLAYLLPLVEAQSAEGVLLIDGEPPITQASLHTALADLYYHGGRYRDQLAAAERALQEARASGDRHIIARAAHLAGIALALLGLRDAAIEMLREAIGLAEPIGDHFVFLNCLRHLSETYERSGDFPAAEATLTRSLDFRERTDWPNHQSERAIQLYQSGLHSFVIGDWVEMRRSYELAAGVWEEFTHHWTYPYAPFALGQLHLVTGDWRAGIPQLEKAAKLTQEPGSRYTGNRYIRCKAHHELAEAELVAGHAADVLSRLHPLVNEPDRQEEAEVTPLMPLLAWAYIERGDVTEAAAVLERATAQAQAQHHQLALIDILRIRGLLCTKQERWQEAEVTLDESLALTRAMRYPYGEAKALFMYGQLHAVKSEPEQACERYQAALIICERLGEGLYRPELERALDAVNVNARRGGT